MWCTEQRTGSSLGHMYYIQSLTLALTPTGGLESPINLTAGLCIEGGNRRKPTQTQHADSELESEFGEETKELKKTNIDDAL